MKPKIFASGSCRVIDVLHDGRDVVEPIHTRLEGSIIDDDDGPTFMGYLHNSSQHIQFLRMIKEGLKIPKHIANYFMCAFKHDRNPEYRLEYLKKNFDSCDVYIFEICTMLCQTREGHLTYCGLDPMNTLTRQTEDSLYRDLETIYSMIPRNKLIILQSHFLPDVIYNQKPIKNRTSIFNTLERFSKSYENVVHHNPSFFLKEDNSIAADDRHFSSEGRLRNFEELIKIINRNDKLL
jgi:hypothetical protein